jgi:isocitrate dehydrogenase kinase/phosphatase
VGRCPTPTPEPSRATHVPAPPHRQPRLRHRPGHDRRLQPPLPAVPRDQRPAKRRFEQADWHGQQRAQRERIEFYDLRVNEAVERLRGEFNIDELPMDTWQQAKLHYIGLLTDHHQPELAETFFNSVTAKLLHRSYFKNDFIFVRPAVSTEYIENDEPGSTPTYRAYYPTQGDLHATWARIVHNFQLQCEFEDLDRDVDHVVQAMQLVAGALQALRANFQIQVLSSLFFRNKGAYLVGKIINGFTETPLALPILHGQRPQAGHRRRAVRRRRPADDLQLRARLLHGGHGGAQSAYVQFLRGLMPRKPRAELYNAWACRSTARTCSTATSSPTSATAATSSASRRASRAW